MVSTPQMMSKSVMKRQCIGFEFTELSEQRLHRLCFDHFLHGSV